MLCRRRGSIRRVRGASTQWVTTVNDILKSFAKDNSGATGIEYALIAALVGIGIIVALTSMKGQLVATFTTTSTDLANAIAE